MLRASAAVWHSDSVAMTWLPVHAVADRRYAWLRATSTRASSAERRLLIFRCRECGDGIVADGISEAPSKQAPKKEHTCMDSGTSTISSSQVKSRKVKKRLEHLTFRCKLVSLELFTAVRAFSRITQFHH